MNSSEAILFFKSNSIEDLHSKIEKEFPDFSPTIQKLILDQCYQLSISSPNALKILDFTYDKDQNILSFKAGYGLTLIG